MNTINTNQLLMQLRAAASQAQGGITPVPNGTAVQQTAQGDNFSTLLSQSINQVNQLQQSSRAMSVAFETGAGNVTLPEVMLARSKASIAFEGMVQVRNKMVEAYQEIMRMQV